MKLVSVLNRGQVKVAALRGEEIIDLEMASAQWRGNPANQSGPKGRQFDDVRIPSSMVDVLCLREDVLSQIGIAVAQARQECCLDRTAWKVIAPIPRPGKIIGVGRNYGAHSKEGGMARQEEPRLFVKLSSSVIGPGEQVVCPASVHKLDWEVELAVVVGAVMRNLSVDACMDRIAGYTLLNDISAREFQFDVSPPQTTFAKSMDSFTPLGPCIVTRDEIADPGNLDLKCWVNDELVQDGNTSDMIFPVGYILSYISRFVTLEPGDVIATGTPAGVGHFMTPPRYLKSGDHIRLACPAIGELQNTVA